MKSATDYVITLNAPPDIALEQAREARVRAWAYVFSCWQAKQKDVPLQTSGDDQYDSTAKGMSHVEHSSDETSSIVSHPLTTEK